MSYLILILYCFFFLVSCFLFFLITLFWWGQVWRAGGNSWELVLFCYHVGRGDLTWAIRFDLKHLYLLRHLAQPYHFLNLLILFIYLKFLR